jgi:hypothetical protein
MIIVEEILDDKQPPELAANLELVGRTVLPVFAPCCVTIVEGSIMRSVAEAP